MKPIRTIRWVVAGMILFSSVSWGITGLDLYARMVYLGLTLFIGSGLWALFSMRSIDLKRQARSLRASVGDVFEEHFEIKNSSKLSCFWLEIINQSNLPNAGGSRLLTGISGHQRRFYTARTLLSRRGAYMLGPTSLASGDPFGLFTLRKQVPAKDYLVVLPMTFPIHHFPPPPGLLPGGKAVRQRTSDVTPHAAGVREYIPGDPMKRIHWPSTAHRGRFMVKEFEQDPQADIWLFLDAQKESHSSLHTSSSEHNEEGWWMRRPRMSLPCDSFEYAISITASLANYFLSERKTVGLACAAGRTVIVSPERGERQISKIMENLAFLQPEGMMPLLGLVMMRAKLLPIGTGVILVTTSINAELLLAVEDLQRRNLRPVVVGLRSDTFGGKEINQSILAGLLHRNVPFCSIGFGEDLSIQLTLPVVYFLRAHYPKVNIQVRS
jgi:uncharacterized protein (DUF58 family)